MLRMPAASLDTSPGGVENVVQRIIDARGSLQRDAMLKLVLPLERLQHDPEAAHQYMELVAQKLLDKNALATLVPLLDTTDPNILVDVLNIFSKFSPAGPFRTAIAEFEGAIPSILKHIGHWTPQVAQAVCAAIASISCSTVGGSIAAAAGAIQLLVQTIDTSSSAGIQEAAATALVNMMSGSADRAAAAASAGAAAAFTKLTVPSRSAAVQAQGRLGLATLKQLLPTASTSQAAAPNQIKALAAQLKAASADPAKQQAISSSLQQLAAQEGPQGTLHCRAMKKAGAAATLLQLIQPHAAPAGTQEAALQLLTAMIDRHDDVLCEQLVAAGGLQAAVRHMASADSPQALAALHMLRALMADGRQQYSTKLIALGAVERWGQVLAAHHGADDWCTVRAADDLSALLILPLTGQQALQAVEQGAVQLLLQCVRQGKEHMAQYTPIMVLLRFLCAVVEPGLRASSRQQLVAALRPVPVAMCRVLHRSTTALNVARAATDLLYNMVVVDDGLAVYATDAGADLLVPRLMTRQDLDNDLAHSVTLMRAVLASRGVPEDDALPRSLQALKQVALVTNQRARMQMERRVADTRAQVAAAEAEAAAEAAAEALLQQAAAGGSAAAAAGGSGGAGSEACGKCGASSRADGRGLLTCSRCGRERYCSSGCQREHWKVHKLRCWKMEAGSSMHARPM